MRLDVSARLFDAYRLPDPCRLPEPPGRWVVRRALAMVVAAVAAAAALPPLPAIAAESQDPAAQWPRGNVAAIDVRSADPALVKPARDAIEQGVGAPYDIDAVRDSLQNIYALGAVANVVVHSERTPAGLSLTFEVEPLMTLWNTEFVGETPGGRSRLRRSLNVRTGDVLDQSTAEVQAERVQQALADLGYLMAVVSAEIRPIGASTRALLRLSVETGAQTTLGELGIGGDMPVPEPIVRAALGLEEDGPYRPVALEEGLEAIRGLLVEEHYFFRRVTVAEQALDLSANTMDVHIDVDPGPRVDLRIGLDVEEDRLHEILAIFEFGTVDDWALKESRHQLVRYLQERGYWKPLVTFSRRTDDSGRNVAVTIGGLRGQRARLVRVDFVGNEAISDDDLRAAIRTREGSLLQPRRWIEQWWEQDREAVLTLYRRRGFGNATIVEAPVAQDPGLGGLRAAMVIEEGTQTLVADVRLQTESGAPLDGIRLDALRDSLQLRSGGPYDARAVDRDSDLIRSLLADAGYPNAIVDSRGEGSDGGPVVTHTIVPGPWVRVDRVLVAGNRQTDEHVIRRELQFVPGSPFSFGAMLESQTRLYRLGIFEEVDVAAAVPDHIGPDRAVVVRVQEAPPLFVSYGAGVDTEEVVRGQVTVGHSNLFGRGQEISLSTRASFREQRVRALFKEPYFLGRRIEATVTGFYTSEVEPSFEVQRLGTSAQLLVRHSTSSSSLVRYNFREVRTFNVDVNPALLDRQDRDTRVGSIGYTVIRDTRPDPIDPRTGSFNTFDVDVAARPLGSTANFFSVFGRSFWHWPVGPVVIAAGTRAGVRLPFGSSDRVPLPERLFAGGSTTLRGFGLDEAGPLDEGGNALGGQVLLVGNLEVRAPLRDELGIVGFLDVGNVFADLDSVAVRKIRESAGFGFRYATPVGPIRLDFAWLTDAREAEDPFHFFFSVGHTF